MVMEGNKVQPGVDCFALDVAIWTSEAIVNYEAVVRSSSLFEGDCFFGENEGYFSVNIGSLCFFYLHLPIFLSASYLFHLPRHVVPAEFEKALSGTLKNLPPLLFLFCQTEKPAKLHTDNTYAVQSSKFHDNVIGFL